MKHFRLLTTIASLFIACGNTSESKIALFKDLNTNGKVSIIGVTPYYDKEMSNKKYAFLINDSIGLNFFKDSILAGNEKSTMTPDDNSFSIFIVNDKETQQPEITVNPMNRNIIYKQKYYEFEPRQLEKLSRKYPVDYEAEWIKFSNEEQYLNFLTQHKTDDRLLCYQNNSSEYEGEVQIFIKKTNQINSWKKGIAFLKSKIQNITPNENDYLISYTPTETEDSVFQFQLSTSESIYNKLPLQEFDSHKWSKTYKELLVYWKKVK